ncbi:hypothetical protein RJ639_037833 [Escallonia herrerae]|uniref:Uncharacterized protein n=1 Tax=Escallonia herrerae TaxID=1293975 RepID=A0AA88WK94_9ASTE|nr:hypothetical protein RJ639_037833 [Escallonia herrerae]
MEFAREEMIKMARQQVRPRAYYKFDQRKSRQEKRRDFISLNDQLGSEDLVCVEVWQASIAELLGTAILVFMIDTIAISSIETHPTAPHLIMAILQFSSSATLPISGGHFNPLITLSYALIGSITLSRALVNTLAQCIGATLGALALEAVVSSTTQQTFSLGGCTITVIAPGPNEPVITGLKTAQAFWIETVCSFLFLFASRWVAFDQPQTDIVARVTVCSIIGLLAGLNVFISPTVTATKGYSGAGINPARCLGPAIVRGGHLWDGHWVFWAGPTLASMAFYLCTKIVPRYKHDFLNILRASVGTKDGHVKKPRLHYERVAARWWKQRLEAHARPNSSKLRLDYPLTAT